MSFKEWTAVIQLVGAFVVAGWLALDHMGGGIGDGTLPGLAIVLLWAVGALIVFNILATVAVTVIVTIVRGEAFKDEPADERDDVIDARSSRIGYAVTSAVAALTLVPLALGVEASLAVLMLFVAPVAGGIIHAAAQLVYYRIG